MRACANCGHENRPGVFFCENCGASLIGKRARDTNSLRTNTHSATAESSRAASAVPKARVETRTTVREGDKLKLAIDGSPDAVTVSIAPEIIFGRRDPATGALPDVDLTPHAGYRMGVSRRHAAIRLSSGDTLDVWDLGSSNGTFLNGQRLSAHRPYRLRLGDELRLGQMVIRVDVETAATVVPPARQPTSSAAAPGPPLEAAKPDQEPPSTEPIYALIAMLRAQEAAVQPVAKVPTALPVDETKDALPAPPVQPTPVAPDAAPPRSSVPPEDVPPLITAVPPDKPAPTVDPSAPAQDAQPVQEAIPAPEVPPNPAADSAPPPPTAAEPAKDVPEQPPATEGASKQVEGESVASLPEQPVSDGEASEGVPAAPKSSDGPAALETPSSKVPVTPPQTDSHPTLTAPPANGHRAGVQPTTTTDPAAKDEAASTGAPDAKQPDPDAAPADDTGSVPPASEH